MAAEVGAITPEQKKAATALAWRKGVLAWKLDSAQKVLYADLAAARKAGKSRFALLCSRRWGKTYLLALMALEHALRNEGAQIAFISKTKRSAKDIADKLIRSLISDCPRSLKPTFHKQDFRWDFVNGSQVFFMGCDAGHYEKARGRAFDLIFIDEAGFIDELEDIVLDVLAPTLLTTNGFMVFASTPPKKQSHPFTKIYRGCQADGAFCFKTIYDNPRLTQAQLDRAAEECGGKDTPAFRREYLCEWTQEESNLVVPEWTEARARELVQDIPAAEYSDKYVSLDLGFRDLTVCLFAWWDFPNARVIVEDELVLSGKETTTAALAGAIALKMHSLWGPPNSYKGKGEVFQFSDVDPRLIYELRTLHGLRFQHTARDNKDAQVNQLRLMVQAGQIIISPRCKTLIQTLYEATWDRQHKQWERKDGIGHADALDALIYLIRNLRRNRNPIPSSVHWTEDYNIPKPKALSAGAQVLGGCYGGGTKSLQAQVMAKLGSRRRF